MGKNMTWCRHQMVKKILVTGPLWGKTTGHWRIPATKASDAELTSFLLSAPEQTVEQRIETMMI